MQHIGDVPSSTFARPQPRPAPVIKSMTQDEARAAWELENLGPRLTPAQAAISGVGLGPPSGSGRADNAPEKVHSEIKVNGKVVARTYNSGAIEIANDFRFLSDELQDSFAADKVVGPDLAEARANRVRQALERHGMLDSTKLDAGELVAAKAAKTPLIEMLRAATAQTQQAWLEMKANEPPMPTGSILSREA